MFIVDDILLSPVHGFLWIVRELNQAVQEELSTESESITEQLRELYMRLELGEITEAQFEAQEKLLLDRLEQMDSGDNVSGIEGEEGARSFPALCVATVLDEHGDDS